MTATKEPVSVYVGCSLTHASDAFRKGVEELKERLRTQGFTVFDFIGLVNGTPSEVYESDIGKCVRNCDVFIAVCDEPSTGLGYELCEAVRLKKAVLAVAKTDAHVTRLVLGAAEIEPNLTFATYDDIATDVPILLSQLIDKVAGLQASVVTEQEK
jgi:nucleoside 2-deoxyribosyltransferase